MQARDTVTVELSAVIVAATVEEPRVLTVRSGDLPGLPSGPLEPGDRTLEAGLRRWVEEQTRQRLGHVEQLYTFGDSNRSVAAAQAVRALSVGYVALVREARPAGSRDAAWQGWYRFFPWEDWRAGRPAVLDEIAAGLGRWADAAGAADRAGRLDRIRATFAPRGADWNEERVLERYELLYGAGLVPEAHRDAGTNADTPLAAGEPMAADHRRIMATAIARLRGKIKYRPLVFELMPPSFTLLQLQRTVEALSGLLLHKPNFRRLVAQQGLIEETGEVTPETGGRPARLWRFRPAALQERLDPGLRLPRSRLDG